MIIPNKISIIPLPEKGVLERINAAAAINYMASAEFHTEKLDGAK